MMMMPRGPAQVCRVREIKRMRWGKSGQRLHAQRRKGNRFVTRTEEGGGLFFPLRQARQKRLFSVLFCVFAGTNDAAAAAISFSLRAKCSFFLSASRTRGVGLVGRPSTYREDCGGKQALVVEVPINNSGPVSGRCRRRKRESSFRQRVRRRGDDRRSQLWRREENEGQKGTVTA